MSDAPAKREYYRDGQWTVEPRSVYDPPTLRRPDCAENQLTYDLDKRGHASALRIVPVGDGDFMKAINAHLATHTPVDPADFVVSRYDRFAADGVTLLTAVEVERGGHLIARLTTDDINISDSGLPFPIHPHAKREQPNNPTNHV